MTLSEKQKEYRARYKEQDATYQKKYRAAHPGLDKKYYDYEYKTALNKKLREEDPIKYLLIGAKSRCKKLGIPFDIEATDLEQPTHCPVFGVELVYFGNNKNATNTASLDRIIPALGYVKGNVIIISRRANTIKNDATWQELQSLASYYKNILTEEIYGD